MEANRMQSKGAMGKLEVRNCYMILAGGRRRNTETHLRMDKFESYCEEENKY
jgi:hypothetical protein